MLELLDKYWEISIVIIGIAFFISWCLSKAAKDPYFDEHEDVSHAEFIDTVELEGRDNPMFKDQAE